MTKCIWLYIKQFCGRINTDYDTVNCRYSFFYSLSYIVKHWKWDNDTWNKKKYVNSAVKNPADSFLKSGTSTTNDKQNHVHVYTNTNWKKYIWHWKSLGTYTRTNAKFAKISVDFMILEFVL